MLYFFHAMCSYELPLQFIYSKLSSSESKFLKLCIEFDNIKSLI